MTTTQSLSEAQMKALAKAASRERGNFCPIVGVRAAAETALLTALDKRGFVQWDSGTPFHGAPRITDAGRAAVAEGRSP